MQPTNQNLLEIFRKIQDPDLNKDIVTLDYVQDLHVQGNEASFTLLLPSPAADVKQILKDACENAAKEAFGNQFQLQVTTDFKVTAKKGADFGRLPQVKNLIAVASGKGGVGKSTITANLAAALSNLGAKVGILDSDIYGPSIPMMFGVQGKQPHTIEKEGKVYLVPIEAHGIKLMSIGFVVPAEQSTVWRGPIATKAFQQLLLDTDWGELDYLLLDVPPGTGDVHLTIVQTIPVTGVVIVTTPQPVAIADATKCVDMFIGPQINVPVLGIVENMSYFVPQDQPEKKYFIFGKDGGQRFADKFHLPLLGKIPLVEETRVRADEGKPIALESGNPASEAFRDLASMVARQVVIRNVVKEATKIVQITRR